jgi:hypothetical protein
MRERDLYRARSHRVRLPRIAGGVPLSPIYHLTGIVFGEIRSSEDRIQSEVDSTGTRHTSESITRVGGVGIVLESGDDLREWRRLEDRSIGILDRASAS